MRKDTISFGAFWDVAENPKHTAGKHLDSVFQKKVPYDIFFTNEDISLEGTKVVRTDKEDLPSLQYIKNLRNTLDNEGDTSGKFPCTIPKKVMLQLVEIWTSKILLFNEVKERCDSEYIFWRDCVREIGHDIISSTKSNKIVIGAYRINGVSYRRFPDVVFEGALSPEQQKEVASWKTILSAPCIKMPYDRVEEFSEIYIETLKYVDRNFNTYDEEIVLSRMHYVHPDMFEVIGVRNK